MSDDDSGRQQKRQGRRLWLTVGEVVAVLGLALAGLNYWESHRDREQGLQQEAQKAQAERRSVFVMRGEADKDGKRVILTPTDGGQVVQTQRYLFPSAVLDHAKEISAGRLEVDLVWFADGLKANLRAVRKSGASLPQGEATLPVGVITTYVERGETRTDQSIYRVGYVAQPRLLGAINIRLVGATLLRRGISGGLQTAVDSAWAQMGPAATAPVTATARHSSP